MDVKKTNDTSGEKVGEIHRLPKSIAEAIGRNNIPETSL